MHNVITPTTGGHRLVVLSRSQEVVAPIPPQGGAEEDHVLVSQIIYIALCTLAQICLCPNCTALFGDQTPTAEKNVVTNNAAAAAAGGGRRKGRNQNRRG